MAQPVPGDKRRWVLSLLEQYEIPMTRFAARLLGDKEAARDVVQHAFLRLCDRSAEELHGRVAQWLFAVCRNKAVDVLRARRRTGWLDERKLPTCPSKEPDPAVLAERHELYRRLSGLIDRLPTGQREAIGLWSEGFRYCEIAEITGRREGNVRVLVHRALKQLRRQAIVQQLFGGTAQAERLRQGERGKLV
jgi:RNA polymerase sigma factor (sigma-70 family)